MKHWLAYHSDFSGMAVFAEEIDALRYAVAHTMDVAEIEDGQTFGPGLPFKVKVAPGPADGAV